jgi:dephospho-CoA kinase
MLRVGLTGGIGAGKSTVSRRLAELGAVVIDADQLAREVVAPGTPGLRAVVRAFGDEVLDPQGALDRPRLASVVFADSSARRRLNEIVHPLVGQRTAELVADAADDAVIVHDVPLLVENSSAAAFALVIVVHAERAERIRRLVADRGMSDEEAASRIRSQADDDARRAAADVWLDNSGAPDALPARVDRLWWDRLVPFERNLRHGRPAVPDAPPPVPADPDWPAQYRRAAARIARVAGEHLVRLDRVGPTSAPGGTAPDVLDIWLVVSSEAAVDAVAGALPEAGFVRLPPEHPSPEASIGFASADPGRPARLLVTPAAAAEATGWRPPGHSAGPSGGHRGWFDWPPNDVTTCPD